MQTIQMGLANDVRALRMTFMGELGWELNIPMEVSIKNMLRSVFGPENCPDKCLHVS